MKRGHRGLWVASVAWLAMSMLGKSSGDKRDTIDTIVIHTIGGPSCSDEGEVQFKPVKGNARTWKSWFEDEEIKGIHYIVDREGVALASISEDEVANHVVGHNQTSIGIELVNTGDGVDPFPKVQIDSLVTLLCDIAARQDLTASNIKGHQDLDDGTITCGGEETRRKVDPGSLFPWEDVLNRVEACLATDDEETGEEAPVSGEEATD